MEEIVSAADANRRFSVLLRRVREGRRYILANHGKPIAQLIAAAGRNDEVAASARSTLLSRLEKQPIVDAGRWTRDELYEDDR
jgi:prevent-host-death family protein